MLLNQNHLLNIDDRITDTIPNSTETYVPNTPEYNIPYKSDITIKMLLKHTAGVFDVVNNLIPTEEVEPYHGHYYQEYVMNTLGSPEHEYTFDELVGVVATCELSFFAPDTSFHYSDTGYSILGKIIERVSGKRFHQFVNDNLLIPNNLSQTSFPYLGANVAPPAPYEIGYSYTGTTLTDESRDNMSFNIAEGNVITTPADLANWVNLLIKGNAGLSQATINLMTAEVGGPSNYGLGLIKYSGLGYGHNGAHGGYLTNAYSDPAQGVTVVLSASVINWNDIRGELTLLGNVCYAAKNILGYSTAEAN